MDWNVYDLDFSGGQPPVPGCTTPGSMNYNPQATSDDGSCIARVLGCMNPAALNFNPNANVDAGNCQMPVMGCTDPTAMNYNPQATTNDGTCIATVPGCTSQRSPNYDPQANTDDGSCVQGVWGCTDSTAVNYNPQANMESGTCVQSVRGCMDSSARNFNPAANRDDGSCILPQPPPPPTPTPVTHPYVQPIITLTQTDGVQGYSTFQIGVRLGMQAANVYAIAGTTEHPMYVPPARFDSLHTDTPGGVPSTAWAVHPGSQYDSFLTIGCIGSDHCTNAFREVNMANDLLGWTETSPLAVGQLNNPFSGGSLFLTDTSTPASANGIVVFAQLTVRTGVPFSMVIGETQGKSRCPDGRLPVLGACSGGARPPPDWDAHDLQWDSPWGSAHTPGTLPEAWLHHTGCTDSTMGNYNSSAIIDDGSCQTCNYQADLQNVMNYCCGHRRQLQGGAPRGCRTFPPACPSLLCAQEFIDFHMRCAHPIALSGQQAAYTDFAGNCEMAMAQNVITAADRPADLSHGR
jgi:hypothetical protein